jgi:PAS domain S-box-containing protein
MNDLLRIQEQILDKMAKLEQREAQWRSAIANAPAFVAIVDGNGTIQFLNRAQPGMSVEATIGKTTYDFVHPEYHDVVRKNLQHVFQTGETRSFESVGAGPNGQNAWYETYLGSVKRGEEVVAATMTALDITERKRAEKALRESELKFRSLFQESSIGTVVVTPKGEFLQVNRAFCEFVGYSERELLGNSVLSITHPEDCDASSNAIFQAAHSGPRLLRFEKRYIHKSGTPLWGEVSSTLICDTEGKPDYFVTQVLDITERKRAEEALKQSHDELERRVEERTAELTKANEELAVFRRFFEASGQGFGMARLNGEVTYVNRSISRLLADGRSEDVIGNHVSTYYPKEYIDKREKEILPSILRDGHWQGEVVFSIRSRSIVALQNSFLVRDEQGNPAYLATVLTDITERKLAEEALRASEERYDLVVRGAGTGIWDWDIRTGKLYFSPRWKAIFGYSEKDIGDNLEDWARLLHPDEKDWMLKFLEDFLVGTSPTVTVEYRLRHKDGSYRWIVAHGLVLRDEQGKAYRFVGSHGDITDRKHAEEMLRREHRTLKHLLQASDHERQIIAYEIHDGLAQQLAGAIMQFQVYDHLRKSQPDDALKAYDGGLTLLRQGHFESRRLISGVRPPILDEEGVVAAVAHLVNEKNRLKGPNIEYHSRVNFDRLAPILENAIYRIAQEGLTNACRHSKSERVRVSLVQRENRVQIEVRDWGTGFDPKDINEGCYGVAGIRQRVRLLGGKCRIRSKADEGTRIMVELPVVERE